MCGKIAYFADVTMNANKKVKIVQEKGFSSIPWPDRQFLNLLMPRDWGWWPQNIGAIKIHIPILN